MGFWNTSDVAPYARGSNEFIQNVVSVAAKWDTEVTELGIARLVTMLIECDLADPPTFQRAVNLYKAHVDRIRAEQERETERKRIKAEDHTKLVTQALQYLEGRK